MFSAPSGNLLASTSIGHGFVNGYAVIGTFALHRNMVLPCSAATLETRPRRSKVANSCKMRQARDDCINERIFHEPFDTSCPLCGVPRHWCGHSDNHVSVRPDGQCTVTIRTESRSEKVVIVERGERQLLAQEAAP